MLFNHWEKEPGSFSGTTKGCHWLSEGPWQGEDPKKQERREQQIASCEPWRSIPKSRDLHSKIGSIFAFRNQTHAYHCVGNRLTQTKGLNKRIMFTQN